MTTAEATDAGATLATKLAATAQYGGSALAIGAGAAPKYFGYTLDEWTLISIWTGIAMAVLGFVAGVGLNWYFKSRHLALAREKVNAVEFYDD